MARPTRPPSSPLTMKQILDNIYQHFVVDKSPKSTKVDSQYCLYSGSGCAIGCMVDIDTAQAWDNYSDNSSIDALRDRNVLNTAAYFEGTDIQTLRELQLAHDEFNPEEPGARLSERMLEAINVAAARHGLPGYTATA